MGTQTTTGHTQVPPYCAGEKLRLRRYVTDSSLAFSGYRGAHPACNRLALLPRKRIWLPGSRGHLWQEESVTSLELFANTQWLCPAAHLWSEDGSLTSLLSLSLFQGPCVPVSGTRSPPCSICGTDGMLRTALPSRKKGSGMPRPSSCLSVPSLSRP